MCFYQSLHAEDRSIGRQPHRSVISFIYHTRYGNNQPEMMFCYSKSTKVFNCWQLTSSSPIKAPNRSNDILLLLSCWSVFYLAPPSSELPSRTRGYLATISVSISASKHGCQNRQTNCANKSRKCYLCSDNFSD